MSSRVALFMATCASVMPSALVMSAGCTSSRVEKPAAPTVVAPVEPIVEPVESTVKGPLELDFIKYEKALDIPMGSPLLRVYFKHGHPSWTVPVWLDYRKDGVRCEGVLVDSVKIPGDRLFVGQHLGVLCDSPDSSYSSCKARRLHTESQWEEVPCPELTNGYNQHLASLGDDVFVSMSAMEGGTDIVIFRWEEDDTYTPLLTHITHDARRDPDTGEIVIESACHPLTGRSMRRYDTTLCSGNGGCGYCDMMHGEALMWTWKPGEEPVLER